MNVVDSSGWLEFFGDDVNADFFADAIETPLQKGQSATNFTN